MRKFKDYMKYKGRKERLIISEQSGQTEMTVFNWSKRDDIYITYDKDEKKRIVYKKLGEFSE